MWDIIVSTTCPVSIARRNRLCTSMHWAIRHLNIGSRCIENMRFRDKLLLPFWELIGANFQGNKGMFHYEYRNLEASRNLVIAKNHIVDGILDTWAKLSPPISLLMIMKGGKQLHFPDNLSWFSNVVWDKKSIIHNWMLISGNIFHRTFLFAYQIPVTALSPNERRH